MSRSPDLTDRLIQSRAVTALFIVGAALSVALGIALFVSGCSSTGVFPGASRVATAAEERAWQDTCGIATTTDLGQTLGSLPSMTGSPDGAPAFRAVVTDKIPDWRKCFGQNPDTQVRTDFTTTMDDLSVVFENYADGLENSDDTAVARGNALMTHALDAFTRATARVHSIAGGA